MDTAKGVRLRVESPGVSWADLESVWGPHPGRKMNSIQHIAIPSTSGTGSEMTVDAVITDRKVQPAIKHDLFVGHPTVSIVDPEIPSTMPPSVTANTGVDVLCHGIEGYLSNTSQPVIDGIALHAMKIAMTWLPRAVENGGDRDAREWMHTGAMMGGISNNSGAIVMHSIAHQLGAAFGVPHGRGCGIMQPYGVAFCASVATARCAEIARHLGFGASSDLESAELLVEGLRDFNRRVGIPASIKQAGVDEEKFFSQFESIAANAMADVCIPMTPRETTLDDIKTMLKAAWEGEPPSIQG
jgi:alcohol dehydrogenase